MKCSQLPAKPGKVLRLEPGAFAATWDKAPTGAIAVGLRTISDGEESTARAVAERLVRDEYKHRELENAVDCYNDALMRGIVARALCDPNNSKAPHPILRYDEDALRFMLTPKTFCWLFEELERLQIESSPIHPEATDDDVAELIALLSCGDALKALDNSERRRVLRFVRYAVDALRTDDPTDDDEIHAALH